MVDVWGTLTDDDAFPASTTYIWIWYWPTCCAQIDQVVRSFFCVNQYRVQSGVASSTELGDVFEQKLTAAGMMIAILDTWNDPDYNTRYDYF